MNGAVDRQADDAGGAEGGVDRPFRVESGEQQVAQARRHGMPATVILPFGSTTTALTDGPGRKSGGQSARLVATPLVPKVASTAPLACHWTTLMAKAIGPPPGIVIPAPINRPSSRRASTRARHGRAADDPRHAKRRVR